MRSKQDLKFIHACYSFWYYLIQNSVYEQKYQMIFNDYGSAYPSYFNDEKMLLNNLCEERSKYKSRHVSIKFLWELQNNSDLLENDYANYQWICTDYRFTQSMIPS